MENLKKQKGNGLRFRYCAWCGKKGMYKVRRWERCRYCGISRLLVPGQDF